MDELISRIDSFISKQQGFPPGPPPREGLVWNPQTHRWRSTEPTMDVFRKPIFEEFYHDDKNRNRLESAKYADMSFDDLEKHIQDLEQSLSRMKGDVRLGGYRKKGNVGFSKDKIKDVSGDLYYAKKERAHRKKWKI